MQPEESWTDMVYVTLMNLQILETDAKTMCKGGYEICVHRFTCADLYDV